MTQNSIRNIIFDLGGVILNIDPQLTIDAFRKLGWQDFYDESQRSLNRELFHDFEQGSASPEAFRNNVRKMIPHQITDSEIDDAWSAMILDIPEERINYLEELKKKYRIFLLSNTSEIHRIKFHRNFEDHFGYSFHDLFEHNFYSHEMGLRKPNPEIYLRALNEANLIPEETLFIDDMPENIEAAKLLGMNALHILPGSLLAMLPEFLRINHPTT